MTDLVVDPRELKARLAAIVDSSDDAIVAKDLNGIIQSWNRGAEQIFGYASDEVVGKSITIIIPEDRQGEEATILRKIRAGERVSHYETVRRRKDGRLIDVSLTISAVRDSTGKVVGASKIARDITEQKAARRALERMNTVLEQRIKERTANLQRAMDELESFNSAVSHDLRTPLRAITGFLQIVLETSAQEPETRRRLKMALDAALEMKRTIEALLRLSRIQAQQLRREDVDVSAMARRILTRFRTQHPTRNVTVDVEDGVTARADPAMTEVVLENLLSNAWKFSAPNADARISVRHRNGSSKKGFIVEDNGIGFSESDATKLFRPFQRLRPGEFEGVGIGLATVQRIVSAHNGSVHAAGRPGAGAAIIVDLGPGGDQEI